MTEQKKGLGCCGCGCLALTLMLVVGGGCTAVVGWQTYQFARDITTTAPQVWPTVQPDLDGADIAERIEAFVTTVEANEPGRLELSDVEINAALAAVLPPERQAVVVIANGMLILSGTLPLDEVPGFRDRFLNGRVTLTPVLSNGELLISLNDFEVDANRQVPPEVRQAIIQELENQNLFETWTNDPSVREFVSHLDTLELVDNRIVLERR